MLMTESVALGCAVAARLSTYAWGRGGKVDKNAQRACERSSDWRRGAAGSPDPERQKRLLLKLCFPDPNLKSLSGHTCNAL